MHRITFTLFLLGAAVLSRAQTLTVHITGIRSDKGSIRLAFYNTAESFDDEKALFTKTCSKAEMKNGQLTVIYKGLLPGVYGLALLDDENNNQKMDYGMVLPKEGFGFSDYYHTGMTRPRFDKFDFNFGSSDNKTVEMKIRYL